MPRLTPLDLHELSPETRDVMDAGARLMGFTPNDGLTMARNPGLLRAFSGLVGAIYGPGKVPADLKRLVGLVVSSAAGCQYCAAHTMLSASNLAVSDEKIRQVWDFESSELFSERERAALRIALHAAQVPNAVDDGMYEGFARHFSETEQVEILAVIALFGFLNRWNSTLATEIESSPLAMLNSVGDTHRP